MIDTKKKRAALKVRLERGGNGRPRNKRIARVWLAGRCARRPELLAIVKHIMRAQGLAGRSVTAVHDVADAAMCACYAVDVAIDAAAPTPAAADHRAMRRAEWRREMADPAPGSHRDIAEYFKGAKREAANPRPPPPTPTKKRKNVFTHPPCMADVVSLD